MVETIIYQLKPSWEKVYTTIEDHDVFDANSVRRYLSGIFDERPEQEHIVVLHLDTNLNIKGREIVAVGNLVSVGAGVREIFRSAVSMGSYGIVIVHNHPSTDLRPSDNDIVFTQALVMSGKIIGIPVYEHYICDSNLEHLPTKISDKHPTIWALSPMYVDDKTMLDSDGLFDVERIRKPKIDEFTVNILESCNGKEDLV